MAKKRNGRGGVGVDYLGAPVVDPTENVKALSEAANKRQDDLRDALVVLNKSRIDSLAEAIRVSEQNIRDINLLRDTHHREIRVAEQERLETIREIDVSHLSNLSVTVTSGFESLRNALASTAARIEAANTERANAISDRVTQLERTSYEGKGKEAVADPMMNTLLSEVKQLNQKSAGISMTWALVIGAAAIIASVSGIFTSFRAPVTPTPQPQPQVYYVPAAPGTLIPSPSAPVQPAR